MAISIIYSQSCLAPTYHICDASDNVTLMIEGPVCICQGPCCTQDQEFVVSPAIQPCAHVIVKLEHFLRNQK